MAEPSAATRNRVDKWLFFARIVKSRTLAQTHIKTGRVRVNGQKIASASATCAPGDVLTVTLDRQIKVLRVLAAGERRGPASEAQTLYEDLSPKPEREDASPVSRPARTAAREEGAGRPTKKERRALDRLRDGPEA